MSTQIEAPERGMTIGNPAIRAVGPITFGPDGILFIADNVSAQVFAVDVADRGEPAGHVDVERLDSRLGAYLGCRREDVFVRDMAIHPGSQRVYLSLMRGSGDAAVPPARSCHRRTERVCGAASGSRTCRGRHGRSPVSSPPLRR